MTTREKMIGSPYYRSPGQITDLQNPYNLNALVGHGYEWISFQAFNSPKKVYFDLTSAKQAGFKNVGIWGVTYSPSSFYTDGQAIGQQAMALGAQHVIVDAEQCLKNTRDSKDASRLIQGIKDGGWKGPVDLTTYGAPASPKTKTNPNGNDFQMDVQSFLDTGGCIMPQAYFNDYPEYEPQLCVQYWEAVGVPADKINVMIDIYPGVRGRIDGAGWVPLLMAAGVFRNFSVYMADWENESDLNGLDYLSKALSPTDTRAQIDAIALRWLAQQSGPLPTSRLRIIHRIAQAANTDAHWHLAAKKIQAELDQAGIAG